MSKVLKTKTTKASAKKPVTKPAPKAAPEAPAAPAPIVTPPLKPSAPPVTKASKDERHRMVAEAAYYISLKKGPTSSPQANWTEAEQQIDAQLKREGRL